MSSTLVNILDLAPSHLVEFMILLDEPPSSAHKLLKCIFREHSSSLEEMATLSPSLKRKLITQACLGTLEPLEELISADTQTRKILFRLEDGKTVESTLMLYRKPDTGRERCIVCVSSQVGCSVGCPFCATGQQGFERNLSPSEIINQILYFEHLNYFERNESPNKHKLTNVVFMGMGEPLANYDNVRQAIAMINSPQGLGFGFHQVTLSTSGMVPQILQLTSEGIRFEIAVSLHAANEELRNRLTPINKTYPLSQLIPACKEYSNKTGRKVYFEYALFNGINDSINDACELAQLLSGLECSINLILCNSTNSNEFIPSTPEKAIEFRNTLIASGIRTMLRASRGTDIEAGCGQLRSRWLNKK